MMVLVLLGKFVCCFDFGFLNYTAHFGAPINSVWDNLNELEKIKLPYVTVSFRLLIGIRIGVIGTMKLKCGAP